MKTKRVLWVMVAASLMGCNTFITPFRSMKPDYSVVPENAVREIAGDVERAVYSGNREATFEDREGVTIDTPEIQQAIRTRAARNELITEFLDSGHAWERNNGLIAILRTSAYKKRGKRQDRDRDALLIMGENNDRWFIYEGIVKANDFSPRAMAAVQALFSEARFRHLKPGQKYENAAGELAIKD